jgi:hypothetical protein
MSQEFVEVKWRPTWGQGQTHPRKERGSVLAFNLKSLNNNASALIEARSHSAGVRSALKNV